MISNGRRVRSCALLGGRLVGAVAKMAVSRGWLARLGNNVGGGRRFGGMTVVMLSQRAAATVCVFVWWYGVTGKGRVEVMLPVCYSGLWEVEAIFISHPSSIRPHIQRLHVPTIVMRPIPAHAGQCSRTNGFIHVLWLIYLSSRYHSDLRTACEIESSGAAHNYRYLGSPYMWINGKRDSKWPF